jgi:hypothetical protein
MFSLPTKTGASKGCGTPTIVRTVTARVAATTTINLGTPDPTRIIVISSSQQGGSGSYTPATLGGQAADFFFSGTPDIASSGGTVMFGVWKYPNETSATFSTNRPGQPLTVYAIYNWIGFKVVEFNSFAGGDTQDWTFVAKPYPANTILFGTWSTNEDGDAALKRYNFGVSDRYFYNTSADDGGSAFELMTVADPGRTIIGDTAGKRRSFGFLSLTCANGNAKG